MKIILDFQFKFIANVNNGSCRTPVVYGCIDNGSISLDGILNISGENGQDNFDDDYHFDLDVDLLPSPILIQLQTQMMVLQHYLIFGCTDENYLEFSSEFNTLDSNQCITQIILGYYK